MLTRPDPTRQNPEKSWPNPTRPAGSSDPWTTLVLVRSSFNSGQFVEFESDPETHLADIAVLIPAISWRGFRPLPEFQIPSRKSPKTHTHTKQTNASNSPSQICDSPRNTESRIHTADIIYMGSGTLVEPNLCFQTWKVWVCVRDAGCIVTFIRQGCTF